MPEPEPEQLQPVHSGFDVDTSAPEAQPGDTPGAPPHTTREDADEQHEDADKVREEARGGGATEQPIDMPDLAGQEATPARLAPHGLRLLAFAVDLFSVAVAALLGKLVGLGGVRVFAPGRQVWQMQGRQPHYTGRDLWVQGSGGQGCTYQWGTATFDLVDHDTFKRRSLSPWDGHQLCRTDRRTG